MKYRLRESAKVKYHYAMLAIVTVALFAGFALQGLGVM